MNLLRFFSRVPARGKVAAVLAVTMVIMLVVMTVPQAVMARPEHPSKQDPSPEVREKKVGEGQETESKPELSNPISPDDFQAIAGYGDSYLARNSAGKKLLYLEGDAYQRGATPRDTSARRACRG